MTLIIKFKNIFAICIPALFLSCDVAIKYPETKKVSHSDFYHGIDISDPYRWLEDDMSD